MGRYAKTAYMAILFANDMKHVHLHSAGEDFDKIHNLAEDYYYRASSDSDYLCELAVENKDSVVNPTLALSAVGNDWTPETGEDYNYAACLEVIKAKLAKYLQELTELRRETPFEDVKSKLDDMLRMWRKELEYKTAKRSQVNTSNFIKSDSDERTAQYAQQHLQQKGDGLLSWD